MGDTPTEILPVQRTHWDMFALFIHTQEAKGLCDVKRLSLALKSGFF